ncbi:D-ser-dehydrat domain-containing protein [Mycena indigotica]|uniref:D-ser-dehydrat domain-containing protein n=1 Tax=Mycena indigotica TaxID=2126181 RepID=A0A8H6RZC4_9AGAR|nr:D-ser-dehydrat domain-containing protein [Mycena indigotica]KAF7289776.1 D-ser-dehydrat domain-containing protein [Mycena indigotica]
MFPPSFNDPWPPSATSLASARASLSEGIKTAETLAQRKALAEARLTKMVADAQAVINELAREETAVQEGIINMKAYLAPIRRLPGDVLNELFAWCFEDHPCVGWVLAAVCAAWRRQALAIPRLWTKIRLVTNQSASPETLRLWLERSGPTAPLDIEVYLRVVHASGETAPPPPPTNQYRGRRRHDFPISYPPPPLAQPVSGVQESPHFTPHAVPPVIPQHPSWDAPSPRPSVSPTEAHWGHVAIFYLINQMHRWERFIFRFEKGFASLGSLRSISGSAPFLKEFEVSCATPGYFSADWSWSPTALPNSPVSFPSLESLALQYTPFRPTSSLFVHPASHLHTLSLRALPGATIPLDQLMAILKANRSSLIILRLHFAALAPAVLPLPGAPLVHNNHHHHNHNHLSGLNPANQLTLSSLEELYFGGYHLLTGLIDTLVTPSLTSLEVDVDIARDPIEDTIVGLVARSVGCTLKVLSIGYGAGGSMLREQMGQTRSGLYTSGKPSGNKNTPSSVQHSLAVSSPPSAHSGSALIAWNFLSDVGANIEILKVGGGAIDGLLNALASPDDGGGGGPNPFWGGAGGGMFGGLGIGTGWPPPPPPINPSFVVSPAGNLIPMTVPLAGGLTLPPITLVQPGTQMVGIGINVVPNPAANATTATTTTAAQPGSVTILPALPPPPSLPTLPPLINTFNGINGMNAPGWLCPKLRGLYLRGCAGHHTQTSSTPLHSPHLHHPHYVSPYGHHNGPPVVLGVNHGLGFAAASSAGSLGIGTSANGGSSPSSSYGGFGAGMDGVMRLVKVIDARNPPGPPVGSWGGGASAVQRLERLEMEDCAGLGDDVVRWLQDRVGRDNVWTCVTGTA